jgi:hypothetical protein
MKYYREYRRNVVISKRETLKQLIKRLIKEEYHTIKESFDGGDFTFKKDGDFKYYIMDGIYRIAVVNFRLEYNINKLNNIIKTGNLEHYYGISWGFVSDDDYNHSTWMKVTGVTFKIINDFIKTIKPKLIYVSSTDKTDSVYSSDNFISLLETLYNPSYNVESVRVEGDQVIILYKPEIIPIDEHLFEKYKSTYKHLNEDELKRFFYYRNKKHKTGVNYKQSFNEQIKRIIYKHIFLS